MRNNAHLEEAFEHRLKRFQSNSPGESIQTLLDSINNYFNNELRYIVEHETYQTSLLIMGIHASILTIAEAFYDQKGLSGYKLFLERFVDGKLSEQKFSEIAGEIHAWRNILAHQWMSVRGHNFGYAYEIAEGWKREDGTLYLNPRVYAQQYLDAFGLNGRIWQYRDKFSDKELEEIKQRIIEKFVKL